MKIESIKKTALTNGQHFSFMEAFNNLIANINDENTKFKELKSALSDAFKKEEEALKLQQKSYWTDVVRDTDASRDKNFGWLKRIIAVWAETNISPEKEAAEILKKVLDKYAIASASQMDHQTGMLTNFIADVESTKPLKDAINTLHLLKVYAPIKHYNEELKTALLERAKEKSGKELKAVKTARNNLDIIYNELTLLINSLINVGLNTEVFVPFVKEWNKSVERYRDMLNRKSGKDNREKIDIEDDLIEEPITEEA